MTVYLTTVSTVFLLPFSLLFSISLWQSIYLLFPFLLSVLSCSLFLSFYFISLSFYLYIYLLPQISLSSLLQSLLSSSLYFFLPVYLSFISIYLYILFAALVPFSVSGINFLSLSSFKFCITSYFVHIYSTGVIFCNSIYKMKVVKITQFSRF